MQPLVELRIVDVAANHVVETVFKVSPSLLGEVPRTHCASNPEFEKLLQNIWAGGVIEEDEWHRYG